MKGTALTTPSSSQNDVGCPPTGARHLYRFEAHLDVQPIGIVPEGLRMANTFEGVVTEGLLSGARVWGIDHLLLRSDGVAVIDAQKTLSLGNLHVYEHVNGYGLPPAGVTLPPLEALLAPGFEWPDLLFPVLASSTFRTAVPALLDLNRTIARIDGWFNFATGRLCVETQAVTHRAEVRAPSPTTPPTSRLAPACV